MKSQPSRQQCQTTNHTTALVLTLALLWQCAPLGNNARAAETNAPISSSTDTEAALPKGDVSQPPEAVKERALERYGKLPISFEANAGQTDGRVKFVARGAGYSLFLTGNDAVLSLQKSVGAAKDNHLAAAHDGRADHSPALSASSKSPKSTSAVVRMRLSGANRAPQVIGEAEQAGKSNYFIGNDATQWKTDVSHYGRVRYKEVYRGIDQLYYGTQGALEYDFIVSPQADYQQIRLQFEGAKQIKLDQTSGELILTTKDGGEVRQHKPVVYQEVAGERKIIDGGYVKTGKREIGFHIGEYDRTEPLVIDPTLVYSTYLGGSSPDEGKGIAVDSQGNAYITGTTSAGNFPTKNPFQGPNGDFDAFITKISDVTATSNFQFSATTNNVNANAGKLTLTVTRTGDLSQPASVDYATSDGTASERSDYEFASGTLSFASGETTKTFDVLIVANAKPSSKTFNVTLSNPSSGAGVGTPSTAIVTIQNTNSSTSNPIDDTPFFVNQQYLDFFTRLPDDAGKQFWIGQLNSLLAQCNSVTPQSEKNRCILSQRAQVSSAFFVSREFQETGYFVIRFYQAAFNRFPTLREFYRDAQTVGKGFVDGQAGADQTLA